MFYVHVPGYELGSVTQDFRQNGFAVAVNGRHFDQLNDAPPRVPCVARFSPARLELRRPLAHQPALQRPPLLIGQVGNGDLQQLLSLDAGQIHWATMPICWRNVRLSSRCQLSLIRPLRTRRMAVAMKSTGWPVPACPMKEPVKWPVKRRYETTRTPTTSRWTTATLT